jgi:hypothetical protein
MPKHRLEHVKDKTHVRMMWMANMVFAARVQPSGAWAMAQAMWDRGQHV